uniref:Similar to Histidine acid phosphatase n=1 Tax=Arundo donax TaxID=35708 RepID=A0A0A9DD70_ARUDO
MCISWANSVNFNICTTSRHEFLVNVRSFTPHSPNIRMKFTRTVTNLSEQFLHSTTSRTRVIYHYSVVIPINRFLHKWFQKSLSMNLNKIFLLNEVVQLLVWIFPIDKSVIGHRNSILLQMLIYFSAVMKEVLWLQFIH